MENIIWVVLLCAVLALLFAAWKTSAVSKADAGTERMKEIAGNISDGARAFLFAEYKILVIFVAVLFVLIGVGIGNFFGGSLIKITGSDIPSIALSATSNCFKTTLPFAAKLGKVGDIFFSYSFLAYAAIIIALITAYFFKHTRTGLQLRAVGENPATSDAAGINVGRYKYVSTIVGSVIAGLGGLYYVMDYANGVWSNNFRHCFPKQGLLPKRVREA